MTGLLRRLVSRLTYANVVSSLALFLVLAGGGALALSGRNSVHSDDIKRGAVRSSDIRDGNVRRQDIAADAVDSSRIEDQTLLRSDFAAGQLPLPGPASASASDSDAGSFTLGTSSTNVLSADITVPARSRMMASATVGIQSDGTTPSFAICQIDHGLGNAQGEVAPKGPNAVDSRAVLTLDGAAVVDPGTYTIHVACQRDGAPAVAFFSGDLLVWAIPL